MKRKESEELLLGAELEGEEHKRVSVCMRVCLCVFGRERRARHSGLWEPASSTGR